MRTATPSLGLSLVLLGLWPAAAADHADGPALLEDPAADIQDVYAFVAPQDPSRLVLVMTVHAFATEASRFSPRVDYVLEVAQNISLGAAYELRCRFSDGPDRRYTCTGPEGVEAVGAVGVASGGGRLRAWAGLADNPYFFDREAYQTSLARSRGEAAAGSGLCGLEGGVGIDTFAGTNVLAIVLEVDSALFTEDGADPQLLVWGRTERR